MIYAYQVDAGLPFRSSPAPRVFFLRTEGPHEDLFLSALLMKVAEHNGHRGVIAMFERGNFFLDQMPLTTLEFLERVNVENDYCQKSQSTACTCGLQDFIRDTSEALQRYTQGRLDAKDAPPTSPPSMPVRIVGRRAR